MIIYTASDQSYADSVLEFLDPFREFFPLRLYRKNCVKIQSENGPLYIKDLRIIKNVKLKDMIMIDNSVLSFAFHLDNGIPILPYYNNKQDNELLFLRDHLYNLARSDDFSLDNGKIFNLKLLMKETMEENVILELSSEDEDTINKKTNIPNQLISISSHEELDKKLNKPVRKDSKFQFALEKTLENAHLNSKKIICSIKEEEESLDKIEVEKKKSIINSSLSTFSQNKERK